MNSQLIDSKLKNSDLENKKLNLNTGSSEDFIIAPSILSADLLNLSDEICQIESSGLAHWHHIDVMDGHFVPNLTFGLGLIKTLHKTASLPLDVHVMISNPDEMAVNYLKAGADRFTFHVEASIHSDRLIQFVKSNNVKCGIAINPATSISAIEQMLHLLDQVLIMSVNPGFASQNFIEYSVDKCARLAMMLKEKKLNDSVKIVVDGGVNPDTAFRLAKVGVRGFVAGSYVYKASDRMKALMSLTNEIKKGLV